MLIRGKSEEEKMEPLQLPEVLQIGVVVQNLEKVVKFYSKHFGLGSWRIIVNEHKPYAIVRGKKTPYTHKMAITRLPPFEFELMEVIKGPCIYKEHLEIKGEGVHHMKFHVQDLEEEIQKYKKHGFKVLQSMYNAQGGFAMMDTDKVGGIVFELVGPSPSLAEKTEKT